MRRSRALAGSLLGIVSLGLGWLFDRSLVERQATAEASAVSEARETAHLGAMTLRATIAQLELSIVAGVSPGGETVTSFSPVDSHRISRGRFAPLWRSKRELPGVSGRVNLKLDDVPWDEALFHAPTSNELAFSKRDNVVVIAEPGAGRSPAVL